MATGLTAQQICVRACGMADVPNYLLQAGDYLNAILASCARNYDFDLLRKAATIAAVAGKVDANGRAAYSLPTDYLRMGNLFYQIQGANLIATEIPLDQYDGLYLGTGNVANPYWWASDINPSPPILYLYPTPQQSFTLNFRYRQLPADIASPSTSSTVPWMPNTRYLLYQVAADLMGYTADERQPTYLKIAQDELAAYMRMFNDDEGFGRQVKLDSRYFGVASNVPSTKQQPL